MRFYTENVQGFYVIQSQCRKYYWIYWRDGNDIEREVGPFDMDLQPSGKTTLVRGQRFPFTFDQSFTGTKIRRTETSDYLVDNEEPNDVRKIAWTVAKVLNVFGLKIAELDDDDETSA